MRRFESWGRYPTAEQTLKPLFWSDDFPIQGEATLSQLPVGMGRSYGDVCLNDKNALLLTRGLNRLLAFDPDTGVLCCEAGTTLAEILDFAVPRGWFLPVTPGTKFVTVGGAIANDVHGKNHHVVGTFGRHVVGFGLSRSDGTQMECSPASHPQFYSASIGGLGLTGLITRAAIQLKPVVSRKIECETIQFHGLEEFVALSDAHSHREYAVSWIDCVSRGRSAVRGIFMCGDHATVPERQNRAEKAKLTIPVDLPEFALSRTTVRLFNTIYFHKQLKKHVALTTDYESFFYPLDSLLHWNRMYGKQGLLQFQCVVPHIDGLAAIRAILQAITQSGLASFLAVVKIFGDAVSPGMMSFPMPGITLTLDFPIRTNRTFSLVDRLGDMARAAGGRLYPAKDARMTKNQFREFYPRHEEFGQYVDPHFSSTFWRRVNEA
jgi:FAD/FMN-containing dehydrogenase